MRSLILNGRFAGRGITGVERVAIELTREMRVLLASMGERDIDMVMPRACAGVPQVASLGTPSPAVSIVGHRDGHAWEQTELARFRPEAWLLSLCNVGPMFRQRQAVVICDAQFVLHPASYSRAFRWWYRVLLSVLSRRAAAIFTISDFSRRMLEAYRIVPAGKAQVLRLGTDHLDRLAPDPGTLARHGLAGTPYILAIGSLARHKNLGVLVNAFIDAALPNISLVIAGGGNARVFQGAGLPAAPNVRYVGRVTDEELKALYAHAQAFACPSLSEGFGFTPLEAMTAGCPVVATTGGAVPEMCGNAALYADPADQGAWRAALRRIVVDEALRATLAGRARRQAGQFRWRDAAAQVLRTLARQDGDHASVAALDRIAAP